jgi:hypothetical protein
MYMENAHGKMSSHPHSSQEQDDAEHQLRGNSERALHRRLNRCNFQRSANQDKHRAKRERDDKDRSQDGSEDLLHEKFSAPSA